VNPAVIRKSPDGVERHGENGPGIADARIKYSIRITRGAGSDAVIVAGPGPIDDIASPDGDRAWIKDGSALTHGHIRRRRGSKDGQQEQKDERQAEIHSEGLRRREFERGRLTRKCEHAIEPE
jgi:hypothetical protein